MIQKEPAQMATPGPEQQAPEEHDSQQPADSSEEATDSQQPRSSGTAPEYDRMVIAAKRKRQAFLIQKLKEWHQGEGQPMSAAEIRELENMGELTTGTNGKLPAGCVRTQQDVADALGVTRRTVEGWSQKGMPRHPKGYYDINNIQAWRQANSKRGSRLTAKERADLDLKRLQAQERKLKIQEIEGELIPRDEVERGRIARIMAVKRKLLSLGRSLAPVLVGMEAREIEAAINERVREIIRSFANDKTTAEE